MLVGPRREEQGTGEGDGQGGVLDETHPEVAQPRPGEPREGHGRHGLARTAVRCSVRAVRPSPVASSQGRTPRRCEVA